MISSVAHSSMSVYWGVMQKPQTDSVSANGAKTDTSSTTLDPSAELKPKTANSSNNSNGIQLSDADLKIIQQLKSRDIEVRAHEMAHLAAAGGIASSGAKFTYQQGPDGSSYAIGGEVSIDTSSVSGNPAATISKAQTIKSAALAPAQPSGQDFQVAAMATAMAAKAAAELQTLSILIQANGVAGHSSPKLDVSA